MKILVPVRYPLTDASRETIECAIELVEGEDDAYLIFLHVNLRQRDESVTRIDLRRSITREFGNIQADYRIREGVDLESVIVDEAVRTGADRVVIGADRKHRLRETLDRILGVDGDIEATLRNNVEASITVVD